jgi:3-oxoacid CoA-transferase subunit A
VASPPKDVRTFAVTGGTGLRARGGDRHGLRARARREGRRHGNLVFNKAARNFNPLAAMAEGLHRAGRGARRPGELDPDGIHLPGIYVHRIVEVGTDIEKRIERRTVTVDDSADRDIPEGA